VSQEEGERILPYLLSKSMQQYPTKLVKNVPENYKTTNSIAALKITCNLFPFGGQLDPVRDLAFFLFQLCLNFVYM
jgi:hypothetical protein